MARVKALFDNPESLRHPKGNMSFTDKVVLVTGGSSGIGASIAEEFAKEGAKVAIVGRNVERLKEVSAKCPKSLIIVADVGKDEDCIRTVNETIAHFGKLDVLVNNAGIYEIINIKDEKAIDVFDRVMATNLRSTVRLTNLAAKHLAKTKGNIINMSSIAGLSVIIGVGGFAYSASKAAMDHFTRYSALDLSVDGIRVNSVNPGPVKTGILQTEDVETWEALRTKCALKRISESKEISDLVMYLASDKAKAMTGGVYLTDNGILLGGKLLHV